VNKQQQITVSNQSNWTREDTIRLSKQLAKHKDYVESAKKKNLSLFNRVRGSLTGTGDPVASRSFFQMLTQLISSLGSKSQEEQTQEPVAYEEPAMR
jgi:hypothetical protein